MSIRLRLLAAFGVALILIVLQFVIVSKSIRLLQSAASLVNDTVTVKQANFVIIEATSLARDSNASIIDLPDPATGKGPLRVYMNEIGSQLNLINESDLAKHWLNIKQKTGRTPPRAISSSKLMLKLVGKYDGSFGVIKESEIPDASGNVVVLLTLTD